MSRTRLRTRGGAGGFPRHLDRMGHSLSHKHILMNGWVRGVYDPEAERFKAMGDPMRLTILRLLWIREACVCELVSHLPISQPAVSQHLRRLKAAGLVIERRERQWVYYRLHPAIPAFLGEAIQTLPPLPAEEHWGAGVSEVFCALVPAPSVPVKGEA